MSTEAKKSKNDLIKTVFGILLLAVTLILILSFISYYIHGFSDQSQLANFTNKTITAENIMGKIGQWLGYTFIFTSLGIAAFFIPFFLFLFAIKVLINKELIKIWKWLSHSLFFIVWLPIALSYLFKDNNLVSSIMGIEINEYLQSFIGNIGTGILLFVFLLLYFVLEFRLTADNITTKMLALKSSLFKDASLEDEFILSKENEDEIDFKLDVFTHKQEIPLLHEKSNELEIVLPKTEQEVVLNSNSSIQTSHSSNDLIIEKPINEEIILEKKELEMNIHTVNETLVEDDLSKRVLDIAGPYDPRLDLPNFRFPSIDMLKSYSEGENITIDNAELEANKNKIVETLGNYGIGITQIKATIGPTVTLYEIVPDAGVRISKIKNLEDDIALSLAALGIRIIAPIPGKGTIGIEVPNSNPTIVSMRSAIASQKFQSSTMELPIAFGKTISNETFVTDLAKMPHLLMAGATGQGKSVGLNAVITSLLYKKHPNELKFVFIDPKKVELTLYNKIERHYLAMIPGTEDAIITDNTKVIHTLNSLCIEMDNRYELLKAALVRNLKEYNEKFIQRKLNPELGHRYLPYIVLVVDEFADLIMTAGKEVETPIARLAQLARAIGIHLIIATQRPSVNVITGIIEANFPARIAFRVTSKIDSRTILDGGGADQLIGKGDMLFTTGNDMVRLQCAFVDTPEVETITEHIGSQQAPIEPYLLPEYVGEEGSKKDIDLSERDDLFEEAARVLVTAQQGSTSLIQRKMSLGYNRAGRIMDQLEAANIVGPFEGSKARKVLFTDLASLDNYLSRL